MVNQTTASVLKEKYEAKLLFTFGGGLWKAGPILIQNLNSYTEEFMVILIDQSDLPIKVNRWDLLAKTRKLYIDTMNEWYEEYSSKCS
jgi:hypothetical protein|tara:strand:- start:659 stop:922 length:264 start_codon:yes stop_codon:yes gene_type:complete